MSAGTQQAHRPLVRVQKFSFPPPRAGRRTAYGPNPPRLAVTADFRSLSGTEPPHPAQFPTAERHASCDPQAWLPRLVPPIREAHSRATWAPYGGLTAPQCFHDEAAVRDAGQEGTMQVLKEPDDPAMFDDETVHSLEVVRCDLSDVFSAQQPGATKGLPGRRGLRSYLAMLYGTDEFAGAFASDASDVEPVGAGVRTRTQQTLGGVTSHYQQYIGDLPVVGATWDEYVDHRGRRIVTGAPLRDLEARRPTAEPEVDGDAAAQSVADELSIPRSAIEVIRLVVFPMDGEGVLAYEMRASLDEPIPLELLAYSRADDQRLLVSQVVSCNALPPLGEGVCFPRHPGAGDPPQGVLLRGFASTAGGRLQSTWFEVRPSGSRSGFTHEHHDFRCESSKPEFSEVSAYANAQRLRQWFDPVVDLDDLFGSSRVSVSVDDRRARRSIGVYRMKDNTVLLADQPRAALSADVCIHELTHAVSHLSGGLDSLSTEECRGLSEGYADFVQAAILDHPDFGDWVAPRQDMVRSCENSRRFEEVQRSDRYGIGTAWAGLLWDLRGDIGSEVADPIAAEALLRLRPETTIGSAVQHLYDADAALFPTTSGKGRHHSSITAAVLQR